jgi:EAL domain-containing protein (putative c-di-GMP-specific phosphodiesterase class I)
MSTLPTATPPARAGAAARARGSAVRQQIDASDLARLVGARLDSIAQGAASGRTQLCALLLVRLTVVNGSRVLLPTLSSRSLLPLIRKRLAGVLQVADRFAVVGPTEFVIFLDSVRSESVARLAMSRLLRALAPAAGSASARSRVDLVIGAAIPSAQTRTAEKLAALADAACTIASSSEDRLHLVVGGTLEPDRSDLVPSLRNAIESNLLTVQYQPQYEFVRSRCAMVEALVRWPRPPGAEPIAPDVLVDLACRHGLIQALTRFVLNTALREIRDLSRSGPELGVAVNVPPMLFGDANLADVVAQALDVWSFPPQLLMLEITEVSDTINAQAGLATMQRLQQLGVRLSIDDFGTGFSSLARLRAMPLAELKIDRLFVANMDRSRTDLQIVRSVIDLAHNFELNVVAEGVEDLATAKHLRSLGCDAMQGFLYARPMSVQDLRRWWDRRQAIEALINA